MTYYGSESLEKSPEDWRRYPWYFDNIIDGQEKINQNKLIQSSHLRDERSDSNINLDTLWENIA